MKPIKWINSWDDTVDTNREILWNSIEQMSMRMLILAKDQKWSELEQLDHERNVNIKQYFEATLQNDEANSLTHQIQKILDIDKQVQTLCQQKKDECSKELTGFQTSRRAQDAYRRNSS